MAQAMPFIMLASTVMGAVGQMRSASAHEEGADLARENAERNAAYTEQEGREQERRFSYQAKREQAVARARAAASGVTMEGTPGLYLQEMEDVADDEVNWIRQSTKSRTAQAQREGIYAQKAGYNEAKAQRSSAWTTLIKGGGTFGASQGWWQG